MPFQAYGRYMVGFDGNAVFRAFVLYDVKLPEYPGDVLFDDDVFFLFDDEHIDSERFCE